jgi:hypothetical protein
LTSRRPQEKAQEGAIGDDADPKVSGSDLEHPSALLPNSTGPSGHPTTTKKSQLIEMRPQLQNEPEGNPEIASRATLDEEVQIPKAAAAVHLGADADVKYRRGEHTIRLSENPGSRIQSAQNVPAPR